MAVCTPGSQHVENMLPDFLPGMSAGMSAERVWGLG